MIFGIWTRRMNTCPPSADSDYCQVLDYCLQISVVLKAMLSNTTLCLSFFIIRWARASSSGSSYSCLLVRSSSSCSNNCKKQKQMCFSKVLKKSWKSVDRLNKRDNSPCYVLFPLRRSSRHCCSPKSRGFVRKEKKMVNIWAREAISWVGAAKQINLL